MKRMKLKTKKKKRGKKRTKKKKNEKKKKKAGLAHQSTPMQSVPAGSALGQHVFSDYRDGIKMEVSDPQNASNHSAGASVASGREGMEKKEKKSETGATTSSSTTTTQMLLSSLPPPVLPLFVAARVAFCTVSIADASPIPEKSLVESRRRHGATRRGEGGWRI